MVYIARDNLLQPFLYSLHSGLQYNMFDISRSLTRMNKRAHIFARKGKSVQSLLSSRPTKAATDTLANARRQCERISITKRSTKRSSELYSHSGLELRVIVLENSASSRIKSSD